MSASLKAHFSRFLSAVPGRLHFAAHSHHPWPDVTFEAQQQAWLDAARGMDDKWDDVFGRVWPAAQRNVAFELGLPDPATVVFSSNTHDFLLRLLACLPRPARVVASDAEFHSFERQTRRLEEDGLLTVTRVPAEPASDFPARLLEAAGRGADLVFFSHVFFNSGAVVPGLAALVEALPPGAMVVVDGYHGFGGVPLDFSPLAARAFYVSGGYKYAMAGEGACFLHVPPSAPARPPLTGWFAAFGALEEKVAGRVPYAAGGARFLGATFDPTALYRFNAVFDWRRACGLTTAAAHAHAHRLQALLVDALPAGPLSREQLVVGPGLDVRGQFLTFRFPEARAVSAALKRAHVITDAREDRLRFGFGVYQDEDDVAELVRRLSGL